LLGDEKKRGIIRAAHKIIFGVDGEQFITRTSSKLWATRKYR